MEALLRTARLEAFARYLIAFLILIATILIRSASSSRWSARSILEHLFNILILHARASIVLALQKLTHGWVETASRRYIIAPSTDRLNARWLLLLAILLIIRGLRDLIRSAAATSVGSSLGREELLNILVLHLFAQEVLVVALKELCLGRIQTARHPSNGRMAGLTDDAAAFGFLLLFFLVVRLVLLIALDSTAANAWAYGIDVGGSFGLNGRHGQA